MERFWALGHFNLGNCTALDAVHTGVDWKTPPGRRRMVLYNPVEPERKPVVLFPSDRFKPLSVSIPGMPGLLDCAWSRPS